MQSEKRILNAFPLFNNQILSTEDNMSKKLDLMGQCFERLTIIEEAGINKHGKVLWKCKCICGNILIVVGSSLQNGHTQSCGCLQKEIVKARSITHGMSQTSTYEIWCGIIKRCNNVNDQAYHHYGGRGITVCERWSKFENFLADMGERSKGLTIERINNNKGYYKANCRWATQTDQLRNQRLRKTNKTGIAEICWHKRDKIYEVTIKANYKNYYLGRFTNIEQAMTARKQAELKYWGKCFG